MIIWKGAASEGLATFRERILVMRLGLVFLLLAAASATLPAAPAAAKAKGARAKFSLRRLP